MTLLLLPKKMAFYNFLYMFSFLLRFYEVENLMVEHNFERMSVMPMLQPILFDISLSGVPIIEMVNSFLVTFHLYLLNHIPLL